MIDRMITRGELMSRVRSKNTTPELSVRKWLHNHGFRFRLHVTHLPGKPDIVLPKHNLVIMVHGCFWHGCEVCDRGRRKSKTNIEFWERKIAENRARDLLRLRQLAELNWKVIVIWECQIRGTGKLDKHLTNVMKEYAQ